MARSKKVAPKIAAKKTAAKVKKLAPQKKEQLPSKEQEQTEEEYVGGLTEAQKVSDVIQNKAT